jgi:hypothetical protein
MRGMGGRTREGKGEIMHGKRKDKCFLLYVETI